jgi:branched-chain amino acid transport system ATP-binding protein
MLKVDSIELAYGAVPVVHGFTFEVKASEVVALVGSNGAGKSTILKAIAGALPVKNGSIRFNESDISSLRSADIVKMGITYVPENRRLFNPLSVEENLEIGAFIVQDERKIEENLEFVFTLFPKLRERRRQRAGTLSGGEQQMLAIGRGLMTNPKILMLDEPSQGLMPLLVTELFNCVERLKDMGMTILLVEQNVQEALEIADRGYVIQTGDLVMEGTGNELLQSDLVKRAFLGL